MADEFCNNEKPRFYKYTSLSILRPLAEKLRLLTALSEPRPYRHRVFQSQGAFEGDIRLTGSMRNHIERHYQWLRIGRSGGEVNYGAATNVLKLWKLYPEGDTYVVPYVVGFSKCEYSGVCACGRLCVCIYAYMFVCLCSRAFVCLCVLWLCVCVCVFVCLGLCVCVCACIRGCVLVCSCLCVYLC